MFTHLYQHMPDVVEDAVHVMRVSLYRGESAEEALRRGYQHYVRQTGSLPPYLVRHLAANCRRPIRVSRRGSVPICPDPARTRLDRRGHA